LLRLARIDSYLGIGLQDPKGQDLEDLDAVLDCDEDIGITVDGQGIRDPAGPAGLPLVGSYYEVFPDHLVSLPNIRLTMCVVDRLRETTLACSKSSDRSSSTRQWASKIT
jgi:hypothetical protein